MAYLDHRHFQVLEMIEQAIDQQAPCPTNEQLREKLGFFSAATSTNLLRDLEEAGEIDVVRFNNARIVRRNGKSTKEVRGTLRPPKKRTAQEKYEAYRANYLPRQYEATVRKLAALKREAERLGVELPK